MLCDSSCNVYGSDIVCVHVFYQQDVDVGDSLVLCVCEVCGRVWMGCENGHLMVFDTSTKELIMQVKFFCFFLVYLYMHSFNRWRD